MMCTASGAVYAWGRGTSGALGVVSLGCAGVPQPLRCLALGGVKIAAVACGAEHSLLLAHGGALYACGLGKRGQLGLGSTESAQSPQKVSIPARLGPVVSISCGANHSLAIMRDGTMVTAGAYDAGALGQGQNRLDEAFDSVYFGGVNMTGFAGDRRMRENRPGRRVREERHFSAAESGGRW